MSSATGIGIFHPGALLSSTYADLHYTALHKNLRTEMHCPDKKTTLRRTLHTLHYTILHHTVVTIWHQSSSQSLCTFNSNVRLNISENILLCKNMVQIKLCQNTIQLLPKYGWPPPCCDIILTSWIWNEAKIWLPTTSFVLRHPKCRSMLTTSFI